MRFYCCFASRLRVTCCLLAWLWYFAIVVYVDGSLSGVFIVVNSVADLWYVVLHVYLMIMISLVLE